MTERIRFSGEQGSLSLDVHGYERPSVSDEDDGNWLVSTVTIKVGPFGGTFRAAITTYDLKVLGAKLREALGALSGPISFHSAEGDVEIEISFDKRGAATIVGAAQPHRSLEAVLKFQLDTDQSGLAQTLNQIESALEKFPLKAD